jgi:hypothetical protein
VEYGLARASGDWLWGRDPITRPGDAHSTGVAHRAAVGDEKLALEDDDVSTYPRRGAFFVAHSAAAGTLGVIAVLLIAGRHHSSSAVTFFWLGGGAYLIGGGFSQLLRFGPVTRQRWLAAHSRVRRGAPRFNDRLVVAFDPYGRALNFLLGGAAVVYGLLRLTGRG